MLADDMLHNVYGDGTTSLIEVVRNKLASRIRLPEHHSDLTKDDIIQGVLVYDYGASGKVVRNWLREKIRDEFSNSPSLQIHDTKTYKINSDMELLRVYYEAIGKTIDEERTYFYGNIPSILLRIGNYEYASKELMLETIRANTTYYNDIHCNGKTPDEVIYDGEIPDEVIYNKVKYVKEFYHNSYFLAPKGAIVYASRYRENLLTSLVTHSFMQRFDNEATINILTLCAEEDILRLRRNRIKKGCIK